MLGAAAGYRPDLARRADRQHTLTHKQPQARITETVLPQVRDIRPKFPQDYRDPYETRAVFADWDGACLCPADEASNYDRTLAPGQGLAGEDTPA
jgi:hypothetical protein